jgi:hypothetical protein
MNQYLTKTDGTLPNDMSFERLQSLGLTPVRPVEPPRAEVGMRLVNLDPHLIDGVYWQAWGQEPIEEVEPEPVDPKMIGIEFDGVMCSATSQDQSGLTAVLIASKIQGTNFKPTRFLFANGNTLVLNVENLQRFINVWMPFRQGFFIE